VQGDYILDTPYTWEFFSDFSPLNMTYVAMMSGLAPIDVTRPFRFLELGCGNGVSTNTYAASHPYSEFHAVDFNPEHIRNASRLAQEGKLDNVTFHEASFEDFVNTDAGSFDFVALHGVYSWVGPDVRAHLRDVIESKLRPGGYVYISYNAMPGWAPILPLRQIMLAYTAGMEIPTIEKVRRGLRYLVYLKDNNAACFANNAPALRMLETLLKRDVKYVAHEFFHKYWTCFYFEEVARELQGCGLGFVGSLPGMMNIRDLSIPRRFRDVFDTARNRVVYETHKSFVLNEMFRRDLYVKLPPQMIDQDVHRAWDGMRFGPLILQDKLKQEFKFPAGTVTYSGPIYPVLTQKLLEGDTSFAELCQAPELAQYDAANILMSLHFLCAGGQFGPFLSSLRKDPVQPDGGFELTSEFNRALLRTRLLADGRVNLASPVIGGGVAVDVIGGLATLAADQSEGEEPALWASSFLTRHNQSLHVGGKQVQSKEEELSVLRQQFQAFFGTPMSRLAEYGIVRPRARQGQAPV
jgi:SAM-dependent methyltransferase